MTLIRFERITGISFSKTLFSSQSRLYSFYCIFFSFWIKQALFTRCIIRLKNFHCFNPFRSVWRRHSHRWRNWTISHWWRDHITWRCYQSCSILAERDSLLQVWRGFRCVINGRDGILILQTVSNRTPICGDSTCTFSIDRDKKRVTCLGISSFMFFPDKEVSRALSTSIL